jgi:transposase
MVDAVDSLPDDVETLKALVIAARLQASHSQADAVRAQSEAERAQAAAVQAKTEAARAKADVSSAEAVIAYLKLSIAKLKRELHGSKSERTKKLIDQMELQLEDMEATASEDELAAEMTAKAAGQSSVAAYTRKKPVKKPFPEHLPRERVDVPGPTSCSCCGSTRLSKLGEDVTETQEVVPRQWKVIQYVREKFTCRDCEKISQAPAPFHPLFRGHVGPNVLAMVLHDKYAMHQPLNRQSERFAREGIDLPLSTLADHVGSCAALLAPLAALIRHHVFAAGRVHGDDTTVPLLAKTKTITARLWTYVRDDAPFGGKDPPAAVFFFSRDRAGIHPEQHLAHYGGILQADAYAGFNGLYEETREPSPLIEAACWAHARRKFFVLADIASKARNQKPTFISPLAFEAVRKIDTVFAIERDINGLAADLRLAARKERSAPLISELEAWMRTERAKLSRHNDVAKAMDYMLKRWHAFTRFLDDGRICMSNNAAERALRGVALGRKAWLFAGSERGGERAALIYTLIQTAKLSDIDPQAWLADVLARINDHPVNKLSELLPWAWAEAKGLRKLVA